MGASPPICLPAALVSLGPLVGTSQGSGVPGRLGAGWATPVPCSPQASLRSLQASPRSEHGLKVPHPHGLPPPLSLPPSVHPASSSSSPTSPTRTDPGHRRSRAQPAVAPGVCGLRPPPPLLVRFDSVLRNRCTLPGCRKTARQDASLLEDATSNFANSWPGLHAGGRGALVHVTSPLYVSLSRTSPRPLPSVTSVVVLVRLKAQTSTWVQQRPRVEVKDWGSRLPQFAAHFWASQAGKLRA